MNRLTRCFLPALIAVMLASTGCGSRGEMKTAGFLDNYEGFKQNKHGNFAFIDKSVSLKHYDAFIIEPVAVKFREGATADVPKEVQDKATRYMKAAVTNAVSAHYAVVTEPGTGVARWRSAITDIRPSGESLGNGGLAAEIEIVDSVTGKRIVAVVADEDAEGEHADNPTQWHDAKHVMDMWAARVRSYFDEVHDIEPAKIGK